jgi:hypothetical protein
MTFKAYIPGMAAYALVGLLLTATFATEGEPLRYDEPVVPPGQDQLLSTMLGHGARLPEGCKFAGGAADGPLIRSTYRCPSGEVVYHIVHPENATESATQTERFAIMVESGAPPTTLIDALASLMRSSEGEFEWLWLTSEEEAAETPSDDSGW